MKIALVCATPTNLNTGMISVDLAFASFLARRGIDAEIEYFSASEGPQLPRAWQYRLLEDTSQLESFDRVVFWGDFLHSRRYHRRDLGAGRPDRADAQEIESRLFRVLMLENASSELMRRVVAFGGTLYINSLADQSDARYDDAVSRLYQNARLVLMRDPVSAAAAERYGMRSGTLGVDCAFLLSPVRETARRKVKGSVGYSFGRGPSRRLFTKWAMNRLVDKLAATSDLAVDIDWLTPNRDDPVAGLTQKLNEIRDCALVVTDTYHCAINAWREGVPALCIGKGAEVAAGTLADKKKELLYAMFGASELYIHSELLKRVGGPEKMHKRAQDVLPHASSVLRNIRRAAEAAEARLVEALVA